MNLYAYGPESDKLRGTHENTDIGDFISEYLGLDLAAITNELKRWVALGTDFRVSVFVGY